MRDRPARNSPLAALVLLSATVLACSHAEPARPERISLLDLFPDTDTGLQASNIELARPEGRRHVGQGWSTPTEVEGEGPVLWATSRSATVRFWLDRPRPRTLTLHCGAMASASRMGARPRRGRPTVQLSLNDRRLGGLTVDREFADHQIRVPAEAQRPGENLLELSAWMVPPSVAHPRHGEARLLACTRVTVSTEDSDGRGDARPVSLDAVAGAPGLRIAPGERFDAFLRVPGEAQLHFGRRAPYLAVPVVRVTVDSADGPRSERIVTWPRAGDGLEITADLASVSGKIVQLTIEAPASEEVRLRQPEILGARPASTIAQPASVVVAGSPVAARRAPNVLVYLVDTLRADALGCYGHSRPTSPNVDALAREGIVFTNVVAQSSWTRPAVGSLFTGLPPPAHGAATLLRGVRAGVPSLADVLHDDGFQTAAFVTNVNVAGRLGFERGFDVYRYLEEDPARESMHVLSDELNAAVVPWLEARDPSRPFFLYVHSSDPHSPYTPPEPLRARFAPPGGYPSSLAKDTGELMRRLEEGAAAATPAELAALRALYEAEIAFNDESFGQLLSVLDRLGLRDETVVVFTADHGEEFGDRGGFGHGHTLYDELIRVPLILRLPGGLRGGSRVTDLTRQLDLPATIAHLVGVAPPAGSVGRDVLALAPTGSSQAAPPPGGLGETTAPSQTLLRRGETSAWVSPDWKVVLHQAGRRRETEEVQLFDRRRDPLERENLAAAQPVLVSFARSELRRQLAAGVESGTGSTPGAATGAPIDAETERRLRALGYLRD